LVSVGYAVHAGIQVSKGNRGLYLLWGGITSTGSYLMFAVSGVVSVMLFFTMMYFVMVDPELPGNINGRLSTRYHRRNDAQKLRYAPERSDG
jgi:uncharacterized membrane protein